jgi:hypothetical protein
MNNQRKELLVIYALLVHKNVLTKDEFAKMFEQVPDVEYTKKELEETLRVLAEKI